MISKEEIGKKHAIQQVVTKQDTASVLGSGLLSVFATPAMIALMEKTCWAMVDDLLPETHGTVGIYLEIKHLKATPVGDTVTCDAILVDVDGSKLTFEVQAHDSKGVIGKGTHKRYVVDNEVFLSNL